MFQNLVPRIILKCITFVTYNNNKLTKILNITKFNITSKHKHQNNIKHLYIISTIFSILQAHTINNQLFQSTKMKYILTEKELEIPEGIKVTVKARQVTVEGPLGKLTRSFRHIPFDLRKVKDEKTKKDKLLFQIWLQKRKQTAVLGTVRGIINNMIRGVTSGYKFKLVLAYAHFPIIANIIEGGKALQVKNFVGIKMNKRVDALEGVTISKKEEEKNIITVVGTDLDNVSGTCALIHQCTKVPNKDLRQFLDGIYIQDARLDINA